MKQKNGFTLLEILIVLLVTTLILGVVFTVYLVSLRNFSSMFGQQQTQNKLLSGLYTIEDDVRQGENVVTLSARAMTLHYAQTTINYWLMPASPNYELWRKEETHGSANNSLVLERVVSPNTEFQQDGFFVRVTLNILTPPAGYSINDASSSITLSSTIYLRNHAYGTN